MHLANLFERQRAPLLFVATPRTAALQLFGKIADVDEIARGRDAGAGNDVFKFAYVAGPGVLQQHRLHAAREPGDIFAVGFVVFFQKELHQQRNVLEALGQRRDADLYGA